MAAGQGFKTFATGDVLSAADVNGYLMQGVLVFADSAERDAEITSPEEGQFAYLKDTNVTTYYTGSAWANLDTTGMTNPMTTTGDTIYSSSGSTPARLGIGSTGQVLTVAGGIPSWATPAGGGGKVLQVIQGTTTSQASVTSTSYISTGITATITPSSATSKVLVIWSTTWAKANTTAGGLNFKLKRASTYLTLVEGAGYDFSTSGMRGTAGQNYLDSPATTSATTYVVDFANFSGTDSNSVQINSSTGTITLMEIGA
jgi:hypothetical protein